MIVIGVDVGGTSLKALPLEVTDELTGHDAGVRVLGAELRRPTPDGAEAVLGAIAEMAGTLRATGGSGPGPAGASTSGAASAGAGAGAGAIGVVVPGIVDEPAGVAVHAANVGWAHTPVRDRLTALTGLPVALGHDVRAGGLAEWRLGAGRGFGNVLVVMLGTGIGSAVISDGRLLTGDGYAGHLGHIVVDPDGPECGCGQRGCLGVLASASAVVRRYRERARPARPGGVGPGEGGAVRTGPESGPANGEGPALGAAGCGGRLGEAGVTEARTVAERARAGDTAAVAVWDETVEHLSGALATAVTLFGPETVVLGGGLALAGDQLVHPIAERLNARLTFQRVPRVVRAELGDRSGIIGAALLAARSRPSTAS